MKQKLQKILIACLVFILLNSSIFVYSAYLETLQGKENLQVASPHLNILSTTNFIDILDSNTYTSKFQVVNYDTNEVPSEVNLSYKISVKTNPSNVPLTCKLYKTQINESGTTTETEVDLATTFTMLANQKQEDFYQLSVAYDLSEQDLEQPAEIFIELEAIQKGEF